MIELYVLDKNLERIGIIDAYQSLIWAKRYNEIGDCELYIQATQKNLELLKKDYYLQRDDDDMVCQIKKIELDTNSENGNYLIITGKDIKHILNQRIVWSQTNADGLVEDYIRELVYKNFCDITDLERVMLNSDGEVLFQLDSKKDFKEITTEQITYSQVGDKIQELCKKYGWGYRVYISNKHFVFDIYQGNNKQEEVTFSTNYENLISSQFKEDSSNLANVALTGGEGEGVNRSRVVCGGASGINRHEIFVDARDISKTINWEELTKIYPQKTSGGQGYINKNGSVIEYKMDYVDIPIMDDNQLLNLQKEYSNGESIVKDTKEYYRISNVVIATLETEKPENNTSVTLKDLVYNVYLLNRGYEKLAERGEIISFEGSIEPNTTFIYKDDYFMGDVVNVENEYRMAIGARIVEIIETSNDKNEKSIEPRFEYIEVKESWQNRSLR